MNNDSCNHTRWKHKWEWHNPGCVWDNLATEWDGKEILKARRVLEPADKIIHTREKGRQCCYVVQ